MNNESQVKYRESSKQAITNAILGGHFSDAREFISEAIECQKMVGNNVVLLTNNEIKDFKEAVDIAEISEH